MAAIICIQDIDKHRQDIKDCLAVNEDYLVLYEPDLNEYVAQCENRFIRTFG